MSHILSFPLTFPHNPKEIGGYSEDDQRLHDQELPLLKFYCIYPSNPSLLPHKHVSSLFGLLNLPVS